MPPSTLLVRTANQTLTFIGVKRSYEPNCCSVICFSLLLYCISHIFCFDSPPPFYLFIYVTFVLLIVLVLVILRCWRYNWQADCQLLLHNCPYSLNANVNFSATLSFISRCLLLGLANGMPEPLI